MTDKQPKADQIAAELRRLHDEAASLRDQNTELDKRLAQQEAAMRQASMTDRVLLVQALMCLEDWEGTLEEDCGDPECDECKPFRKTREVIAALRERLAQPIIFSEIKEDKTQPVQEPVAMRYDFDGYGYRYIDSGSGSNWQTRIKDAEPLYAIPPQPDTKVNFEAIPEQISEPMAWNLVDPSGKVVATHKTSVHCWARIRGFKPTVETLLGFHDQGWRVVPSTAPPRREWQGLTDEEIKALPQWFPSHETSAVMPLIRAIEAKLKEKNHE